ncbi:MAG: tetratricopeptide repeat protein [Pseudomonadota bacterium]
MNRTTAICLIHRRMKIHLRILGFTCLNFSGERAKKSKYKNMKNYTKYFRLLAIVLILSSLFLSVNTQASTIDSLENLLQKHTQKDSVRVNLLLDIFTEYIKNRNLEKAIEYNKIAEDISKEISYERGIAKSIDNTGTYYYNKGDLNSAAKYWLISLEEFRKLNDLESQSRRSYYIAYCYLYTGNILKAIEYSKISTKVAKKIGSKERIASGLALLGDINKKQNNYFVALDYCLEALNLYKELNIENLIARTTNVIGEIYGNLGDYPKAAGYFFEVLKIAEKTNDKASLINGIFALGDILILQNEHEKAKEYFQRGLKIAQELKNELTISNALTKLGEIETLLENYPEALEYYYNAYEIAEKIGTQKDMASNLCNIANIMNIQGETTIALEHLYKATEIYTKIDYKYGVCISYYEIGSVYMGIYDYTKALYYTKRAIEISIEKSIVIKREIIYKQLSEVYAAQKNYKKAYENYILYKELNDSLFSEKNIKEFTSLENKYQFKKEKHAIELEQQKKDAIQAEQVQKQKVVRNSFIVGFVLMVLLVLVIFSSYINKRKANFILAEQKEEIETQAEELDGKNRKLTQLAQFKDDLTNMIVHDLKNPLSNIINIELFSDSDDMIDIVRQAGFKMLNLVQNILDVYKYETTEFKLNKSKNSLTDLINEAIIDIKFSANQKSLSFEFIDLKDVYVNSDAGITKRILVNILTNAVKFSPKNEQITVKVSVMDKDMLRISIHNQGPGIPKHKQNLIFERFGQSKQKNLDKIGSTGLGLTFCKMAVEAHSGKIGVVSESKTGIEFWFTLPDYQVSEITSKNDRPEIYKEFNLTESDKEYLLIFINQIISFNIFEISSINSVLKSIDKKNPNINNWVEEITEVLYSGNEVRYNQLINF